MPIAAIPPKIGGCGQIRTDYLALMRRLLIRMSFAALARVGGLEPPGPVLETGSVAASLTPSFSKTNKKPRPESGSGARRTCALRPSRHDSPNDPLAGHSDYVVFEGPKHRVDSLWLLSKLTVAQLMICGAPGRIRTCVHFVRSEGHQSSLARALITLVGELRIELRPRAPKARMQRITLFPDGASPAS